MENQQYRRWDSNSPHGQLLLSLIVNKHVTDRMPTQMVQELYPQFRAYPTNNFSTILSRYRKKVASGEYGTPNNIGAQQRSSVEVTPAEFASNFYDQSRKLWLIVILLL